MISTTPSLVFTTSSSGEKWLTSSDTFQLSWVCLISDTPLLIWRVRGCVCGAIMAPGYITGAWGVIRPMSGARMEGRMYPGQWLLGNVAKSVGMAGMPKDWSKMRLCWCQSRNGSQLGVRSRVKGIRLSAIAAVSTRCSEESGCRFKALWYQRKRFDQSGSCLSAVDFYTH